MKCKTCINEWYEEQEATLDREAKLKKEINDGKIKEPSKVTGRKKKSRRSATDYARKIQDII